MKVLNVIGFIFIFFLFSCKEEGLVFNSDVDDNFELPLLLSFNHTPCFLDYPNKTFRYSIKSSEVFDFTVYVEFQDHSSVTFNNIPLENEKENNLGKIEINTPYELVFDAFGEQETFYLEFTNVTTAQVITHDKIRDEPKSLARLIVNDKDYDNEIVNTMIGIEKRGGTSINRPKTSLGFAPLYGRNTTYIKKMDFLDMPSNTKWIFDAMYLDKSKLRNITNFQIWQSLNSSNDKHKYIEGELIELFINNESAGIYHFNEAYTKCSLNASSSAVLYEGNDNAADTKFEAYNVNKPKSAYWGNWEQKLPDPNIKLDWAPKEQLKHLVIRASDEDFKSEIAEVLDIDIAVDYYLFINLIGAFDNLGKNWVFFRADETEKLTILPWDLDGTWGRGPFGEEVEIMEVYSNGLFDRLMELNPNSFRNLCKERWFQYRAAQFSKETLRNKFQDNFKVLKQTRLPEIEHERWGLNVDVEFEEAYILDHLSQRLIFLDQYFNQF